MEKDRIYGMTNGDDMGELKMLAEGDVLAGTPLFKF